MYSSDLGWDHSCDVWSIGCILIEYYLGSTLFQVGNSRKYPDIVITQQSQIISTGFSFRPTTVKNIWPWWRESWAPFLHISCRKLSKFNANAHLYFFRIKQMNAVKLHVPVFARKRRFVHKSKLDWDVHSSSGRYVRKRCKPLKVRRILKHFFCLWTCSLVLFTVCIVLVGSAH